MPDLNYLTLAKEECKEHPFLVRTFYKKGDLSTIHYTFYPWYNKRKYKVLLEIKEEKISCTISCVILYNDIKANSPVSKDVVTFDFDPGITPENVLKKLPTILTFL